MRRHFAFIIILLGLSSAHAAENNSPTFKMTGDVSLLSHYVEYGLSQSDKSPALQGSFWFNFGPQFRLGLWGSNTNFEHSDDHFNLRINGDIKIDFSQANNAVIYYSESQYFKAGDRNGNLFGLHLNFSDFKVLYDHMSNWEGTKHSSVRYGLGLDLHVWNSWIWVNEVGYNTPDVTTVDPYFDFKTGLGTKWGPVFVEGSVTGTSASSDLDGQGDFFFILSAKTEF
ncbi:TorF family putative porin [Bdellovibrio sp. NC01]|uniref:TorF family putative porin n=1 Tax=Bdellovibrio sp. NC01 TaxID=2220073 RepID=UPI0011581828|nr:TorF family putative porin [Bdellovibrio sp. NC01]QDK38989.1 hypothetical protein DOE51_16040 [Bdellovibrio sp. NC01]